MEEVVKVGLLGAGTVGGGVIKVLEKNGEDIAKKAGCLNQIVKKITAVKKIRLIVGW